MRWKTAETWVTSLAASHPPLVTRDLWERAQAVMATRDPRMPVGTPRAAPGRYVLAGLMVCHHCGRRVQGSHTRGHAFYRCRLANSDYAAPPPGHPRTLAIREDRILPALDHWLVEMFSPERTGRLTADIMAADAASVVDPAVLSARRQVAEARRKIDRHLAALEAGLDPALVAERTRNAQAQLVS
jgi:site-specific DNA recombinase